MHYYFDESGQISFKVKESYFVIAGFSTENNKEIQKKMKVWFQNKFPKNMRMQSEIKWSAQISDALRISTLKFIKGLDIFVIFKGVHKQSFLNVYRKLDSSKIYIDLLLEILHQHVLSQSKIIYIYVDRRPLKYISSKEFAEIISESLYKKGIGANSKIDVLMIDSTSNVGIQISDWIAGAVLRYLEKGHLWKQIGEIFDFEN